jgi:hypothetical protein
MQRLAGLGLLMAVLVCSGCFTTGSTEPEPKAPAPISKGPPPIRAEQITAENGHQVAQALEDELNREAHERVLNPR